MDADNLAPEPEPRGELVPPRRRPPTAVGVATPPPPKRPHRSRGAAAAGGVRGTTRIARGMLGSLLVVGGAALLWPVGLTAVAGAALVGLGADVLARSAGSPGLVTRLVRRVVRRRRAAGAPPGRGGRRAA